MISPRLSLSPRRIRDESPLRNQKESFSLLFCFCLSVCVLRSIGEAKQEGASATRGVYSLTQNNEQNVVFGNVPESQLPFFACQATHDSNIAEGSSKKRKSMDVSHSASSKAIDVDSGDEATTRPPGVKAAKVQEFQTMWSLKKEDLTMKKELPKIKLLETLIAKEGSLADYEETLKKKLINELGYN
ncbi:hypothetical protein Bca4012_078374 [Brassica carinata]|uniref:Uncharacterized protein n=1 Tax=Brassica carinata TaxID=52824 RepID=A0A8X7U3D2_BRACI|nr:hypothetical protein Bca52824_071546 [Brassica carinata]